MAQRSSIGDIITRGAAAITVGLICATPQYVRFKNALFHYMTQSTRPHLDRHVYFENCFEAKIAGAAPMYKGDPGYRHGLDPDGDGIACDLWSGQ